MSDPSATPVAMSMACLHASTQSIWHATSAMPMSVFATACLRAPSEFFHSHLMRLVVFILFFSFTFCKKYVNNLRS